MVFQESLRDVSKESQEYFQVVTKKYDDRIVMIVMILCCPCVASTLLIAAISDHQRKNARFWVFFLDLLKIKIYGTPL